MDPTICYQLMIAARRDGEYATAREYALILQTWLRKGGFYPKNYDADAVDSLIAHLLKPACSPDALVKPFESLSCIHCDAGSEITSLQDAIDDGWTKLQPVADLPQSTHLGLCRDCRRAQDEDQ